MQDDPTLQKWELFRQLAKGQPGPVAENFRKIGEAYDSMLVTAPGEARAMASFIVDAIERGDPAPLNEAAARMERLAQGGALGGKGGSA